MHSIALVNQKGGVGKSTTAVNLSAGLAKLGRRVILIDLDPQAHSTVALGLQPKKLGATIYSLLSGAASLKEVIRPLSPGLSIIPSTINLAGGEAELTWQQNPHFILKKAMSELPENDYDFVIVDSPPQLGFLNVNSLAWVKNVFIPLTCEFYALHGLSLLVETVERIQAKLNPTLQISGVIACQYNARRALTKDVLADLEGHFPGKVMKSRIRVNVRLAEAPSHGMSIHDYAPGSSGSKDYMNLAREILERFPAEASPEVEAQLAAIAAAKAQERGVAWTESTEPVAPTWSDAPAPASDAAAAAEATVEAVAPPPALEAAPAQVVLAAATEAAPEPSVSPESAAAETRPAALPEPEVPAAPILASEPIAITAEAVVPAAESAIPEPPAVVEPASPEAVQAEAAPAPAQAAPVEAVAAVAVSEVPDAQASNAAIPETGHVPVDPLADLLTTPSAPVEPAAMAVEVEVEVTMPEPADHGRVIEPSSPMIISAEELAAAIPPAAEPSVETPSAPAPETAPEPVAAAGDDPAARLGFDPYAESSPHLEAPAKPAEPAAEFVSPLPATPVSELRAAIQSDASVPASPESTVKPVPTLPSVKAASMPFNARIAMAGLKPIVTSKPGTAPPPQEKKGLLGKLMPWRR